MGAAAQSIGLKHQRRLTKPKRTSQGTYGRPKNKHKRKSFKFYRGQG